MRHAKDCERKLIFSVFAFMNIKIITYIIKSHKNRLSIFMTFFYGDWSIIKIYIKLLSDIVLF